VFLLCVSILVWPLHARLAGSFATNHLHPKSPLVLIQDDASSRRCAACVHTARITPSDPPVDTAALRVAVPGSAPRTTLNASSRVTRCPASRLGCALRLRAPPSLL
jgi:hypothetical protein